MEKSGQNSPPGVQVAVRVKPHGSSSSSSSSAITPVDEKSLVVSSQTSGGVDTPYEFDSVLESAATQENVYTRVGWSWASACVGGQDVCVFVYGARGAGKRYTLFSKGGSSDRGLVSRCLDDVFQLLQGQDRAVVLSAVEIQNRTLRDLGAVWPRKGAKPSKKPATRVTTSEKGGGLRIVGLTKQAVLSEDEANALLDKALAASGSAFAPLSGGDDSRSTNTHIVITLTVAGASANAPASSLCFVKLAGSEPRDDSSTDSEMDAESLASLRLLNEAVTSQWLSKPVALGSITENSLLTALVHPYIASRNKHLALVAVVQSEASAHANSTATLQLARHWSNLHHAPGTSPDSTLRILGLPARSSSRKRPNSARRRATQPRRSRSKSPSNGRPSSPSPGMLSPGRSMHRSHSTGKYPEDDGLEVAALRRENKALRRELEDTKAYHHSQLLMFQSEQQRRFYPKRATQVVTSRGAAADQGSRQAALAPSSSSLSIKTGAFAGGGRRGTVTKGHVHVPVHLLGDPKKLVDFFVPKIQHLRKRLHQSEDSVQHLQGRISKEQERYTVDVAAYRDQLVKVKQQYEESKEKLAHAEDTFEKRLATELEQVREKSRKVIADQNERLTRLSSLYEETSSQKEIAHLKRAAEEQLVAARRQWAEEQGKLVKELQDKYEYWLAKKTKDLNTFVEEYQAYRSKRDATIMLYKEEIRYLYDYISRLSSVFENMDKGLYPVSEKLGIKRFKLPDRDRNQLPLDASRCRHLKKNIARIDSMLRQNGLAYRTDPPFYIAGMNSRSRRPATSQHPRGHADPTAAGKAMSSSMSQLPYAQTGSMRPQARSRPSSSTPARSRSLAGHKQQQPRGGSARISVGSKGSRPQSAVSSTSTVTIQQPSGALAGSTQDMSVLAMRQELQMLRAKLLNPISDEERRKAEEAIKQQVLEQLASDDTVQYIKRLEEERDHYKQAVADQIKRRNDLQIAYKSQSRLMAKLQLKEPHKQLRAQTAGSVRGIFTYKHKGSRPFSATSWGTGAGAKSRRPRTTATLHGRKRPQSGYVRQ